MIAEAPEPHLDPEPEVSPGGIDAVVAGSDVPLATPEPPKAPGVELTDEITKPGAQPGLPTDPERPETG